MISVKKTKKHRRIHFRRLRATKEPAEKHGKCVFCTGTKGILYDVNYVGHSMAPMIKPELQDAYFYDLRESANDITAFIQIPQSLKVEDFNVVLSEDKTHISVDIGQEIPVLQGEFFADISDFEKITQGNVLMLKFQKVQPGPWPVLIRRGKPPNYMEIDPKSAFMIFDFLSASDTPSGQSLGMAMLHTAAQMGFSVAMVVEAAMMLGEESMVDESVATLQNVASVYNHSGAYFILGRLFNPNDTFEYAHKDAAKAVEFLEKGISITKEPIPMRMLIELYTNGNGVEKDLVRAEELRVIAEEIESRMPKHQCGCGCEDHEQQHSHSHEHSHEGCGCGHSHEHEHSHEGCGCGHSEEGHNHKDGECCGHCH